MWEAVVKVPLVGGRVAAVALVLGCMQIARGSDFGGVLEFYSQATKSNRGLVFSEFWSEERLRVSPDWKIVAGQDYVPGSFTLDATFAEYDQPTILVRLGRIRSNFGFGQWSDTNYNVELQDPMIRTNNYLRNLSLNRNDDGVEARFSFATYELTFDVLDVYPGNLQLIPSRPDHFQARFQHNIGPIVIGIDGLTRNFNRGDLEGQALGCDFRYTNPHFLARGEMVRGTSPGFSTNGYYVDLTYRNPHFYRTELGIRNEAFGVEGSGVRSTATTIGLRHIFGPSLTCNLNYGFGKAYGDLKPLIGWSFETCYYVHF